MAKSRVGKDNPFFGKRHTDEWKRSLSERQNKWSQAELATLREWYMTRQASPLDLTALAQKLGRNKQVVCRMARKLGLSNPRRQKPTTRSRAKYTNAAERNAAVGAAARARIKENGHPRGALGMAHTAASRSKISAGLKARVARGEHPANAVFTDKRRNALSARMTQRIMNVPTSVYSHAKRGYRADLGDIFFRSRWEANYARFLCLLQRQGVIAKWEFEAETFWFDKIKRGVRSYTPDFRITRPNGSVYFVEVKGWMDPKSKTKIARMGRYHPTVELQVFDAKAYRELARKLGPAIPEWERDK